MSLSATPKFDFSQASAAVKGGIQKVMDATGKLPPISLVISPLDGSGAVYLDRFLTYKFSSSILIPVDTFSFSVSLPDAEPFYKRIKEGDIVTIFANQEPLSTGIIDIIDIETDSEYGERIMINGRDLLSQFEDQDSISVQDKPIWGNKYTVDQAIVNLLSNTRLKSYRLQNAPKGAYLFATEPGENKISSLQRYLEPLNCIFWTDPNGKLVVGRPNMSQKPSGLLILSKEKRQANVISMKCVRSGTNIPNIIVPFWTGQENVLDRTPESQRLYNSAQSPNRLRKLGHRVPKGMVVSTPQGADPQSLSGINQIEVAGSNLLQAYAKREVARQNQKEVIVQAIVPGHYNEIGKPYKVDTVYKIEYDRGSIDENMYLFQVEFDGSEESGMKTSLFFCRKGTIVADNIIEQTSTTTAGGPTGNGTVA